MESGEWTHDASPLAARPTRPKTSSPGTGTTPYSRETAAFPLGGAHGDKYWPPVSRIDGVYGDRNVVCSCGPIEDYADPSVG